MRKIQELRDDLNYADYALQHAVVRGETKEVLNELRNAVGHFGEELASHPRYKPRKIRNKK